MAIVEFVNGKNNRNANMKRTINYILREDKVKSLLYGGHNCDPENAFKEFIMMKRMHQKETGRLYIHFVQSFASYDKVDAPLVKQIADELLNFKKFEDYQVVYSVHEDTDNLHAHFVLNTVNIKTGEKYQQSSKELKALKEYSDMICKKYNLIITHGISQNHKKSGEFRSEVKSRSWKYETYLAVKEAKYSAISKNDFINKMEQLGYQVLWKEERKYITFTNKEGKKIRNKTLKNPEKFSKEKMIQQFEFNKKAKVNQKIDAGFESTLAALKLMQLSGENYENDRYPLSTLQSKSSKDIIAEVKKNSGLSWER